MSSDLTSSSTDTSITIAQCPVTLCEFKYNLLREVYNEVNLWMTKISARQRILSQKEALWEPKDGTGCDKEIQEYGNDLRKTALTVSHIAQLPKTILQDAKSLYDKMAAHLKPAKGEVVEVSLVLRLLEPEETEGIPNTLARTKGVEQPEFREGLHEWLGLRILTAAGYVCSPEEKLYGYAFVST